MEELLTLHESLGEVIKVQETITKRMEVLDAVARHIDSVAYIKINIKTERLSLAAEALYELPPEDRDLLWTAETRGGIFTAKERDVMRSKEFRESYYGSESNE